MLDSGSESRVRYTGTLYSFRQDSRGILRLKLVIAIVYILALVLFLSAGYLNNEGGRLWYVVIPYAVMAFPLAFAGMGCVSFLPLKSGFTQRQHDKTIVRMQNCGYVLFAFGIFCAVGCIYAIVSGNDGGKTGTEALFAALNSICAVCGFALARIASVVNPIGSDNTEAEKQTIK